MRGYTREIMKPKLPFREESKNISFSQRWRGKFKLANKSDARYQALVKRYLAIGLADENDLIDFAP